MLSKTARHKAAGIVLLSALTGCASRGAYSPQPTYQAPIMDPLAAYAYEQTMLLAIQELMLRRKEIRR